MLELSSSSLATFRQRKKNLKKKFQVLLIIIKTARLLLNLGLAAGNLLILLTCPWLDDQKAVACRKYHSKLRKAAKLTEAIRGLCGTGQCSQSLKWICAGRTLMIIDLRRNKSSVPISCSAIKNPYIQQTADYCSTRKI